MGRALVLSLVAHAALFFGASRARSDRGFTMGTGSYLPIEVTEIHVRRVVARTAKQSKAISLPVTEANPSRGGGDSEQTIDLRKILNWGNRPPSYPREALEKGWEGEVRLCLVLGSLGEVVRIEILESSGYQLLDEEAVSAARQWHVPAGSGRLLVPIRFKIAD